MPHGKKQLPTCWWPWVKPNKCMQNDLPCTRGRGFTTCSTSHPDISHICHYKVNMLLTDTQNLSISDLGYHGHPEAVSGWGWAARCRGYHPPRGRRPRCSICAAGAAMMTSALVYSGGSVRCTSTGHLDAQPSTHTHTHTVFQFTSPMCNNDVSNESYSAGRCVFLRFKTS